MDANHNHEGRPDRRRFFAAVAVAAPVLVCLLWMAWRAMRLANPWFTGMGFVIAALYLVVAYWRRTALPPPFGGHTPTTRPVCQKPVLRLVKK